MTLDTHLGNCGRSSQYRIIILSLGCDMRWNIDPGALCVGKQCWITGKPNAIVICFKTYCASL